MRRTEVRVGRLVVHGPAPVPRGSADLAAAIQAELARVAAPGGPRPTDTGRLAAPVARAIHRELPR